MTFRAEFPVRFAYCDPAGIVYYPRYLELLDHAVEDWTAQVLGVDRNTMHLGRRLGLPMVDLHANFQAPSQLGDMLVISLSVAEVGRSSVMLAAEVESEAERRFSARLKMVLMNLDTRSSAPWPDEWRQKLIDQRARTKA